MVVPEFSQVFEGVETGMMLVAEQELDGVSADEIPAGHGYSGKLGLRGAAVDLAEKIAFPDVFRTGRHGAQKFHRVVGLDAIFPGDGNFISDGLNIFWSNHEGESVVSAGSVLRSREPGLYRMRAKSQFKKDGKFDSHADERQRVHL